MDKQIVPKLDPELFLAIDHQDPVGDTGWGLLMEFPGDK